MCSNISCLVLRLDGPMQSWGTSSQFNRRQTDLLPSRSAIFGILCASLGVDRGSEEESEYFKNFSYIQMKSVAIPRIKSDNNELLVKRMDDFHTIMNTPKADGGTKDCHITNRQYLLDASFRVFITGEKILLQKLADAITNPVWGVWLGRKCCIPSAPIFGGLFDSEQMALQQCLAPFSLDNLFWTGDAQDYSDGDDSVPDIPLSFGSSTRHFILRRIQRHITHRTAYAT